MPSHTTLMVEQPETQVHPSAQLDMGELFAELWKENKVGSIIETHSSNIILRLQRLVANDDLSATDVSIAFFKIDDKKMPVVENLDVQEDGSLRPGLPMEFFHPDIWEAMEIGDG